MNIIIIIAYFTSFLSASEAIINMENILSESISQSNKIIVSIYSNEEIYGIQFDIIYEELNVELTDVLNLIETNNSRYYNSKIENGLNRILVFNFNNDKLIDSTQKINTKILEFTFAALNRFKGNSTIKLSNIIISAKGGLSININAQESKLIADLSFIKPNITKLNQNFPNPFNFFTNIEYQLSRDCIVSLVIYNNNGGLVKTLINEFKFADYYNIEWDGKNIYGQDVKNGKYLLKIVTPFYSKSIEMIMVSNR